jgi:RNA polymerase sigma-70 factor (ECF subfamily)
MHDERLWAGLAADRHRLVRAAARLIGPVDAEDAVQDACVRALEAAGPPPDQAAAWLTTVVRHAAIDRLRRERWIARWQADAAAQPDAHGLDEAEAATAEQACRQALQRLAARASPAEVAIVLLHAVFEVPHAELAAVSGRSEAACRQQLRRALAKARRNEAERGEPDPVEAAAGAEAEAVLRTALAALRQREPEALWAWLAPIPADRPAPVPVSAPRTVHAAAATGPARTSPVTTQATRPASAQTAVVQIGGGVALVLTLDGVTLCVLPLGSSALCEDCTAIA